MFYEQLKKACLKRGTSPSALAQEFGLTTANTGKWKNGGKPSVDILIKFADRLGVSTDYLLKGEEPQMRSKNERDDIEMLKTLVERDEVEKGLRALFDNCTKSFSEFLYRDGFASKIYNDSTSDISVDLVINELRELIKNTNVTWVRIREFVLLAYDPASVNDSDENVEAFFPSSLEFDELMFKSRCW